MTLERFREKTPATNCTLILPFSETFHDDYLMLSVSFNTTTASAIKGINPVSSKESEVKLA